MHLVMFIYTLYVLFHWINNDTLWFVIGHYREYKNICSYTTVHKSIGNQLRVGIFLRALIYFDFRFGIPMVLFTCNWNEKCKYFNTIFIAIGWLMPLDRKSLINLKYMYICTTWIILTVFLHLYKIFEQSFHVTIRYGHLKQCTLNK